MKYEVHTVRADQLPKGIDRVIVEQDDGSPLLLIAGEPARCWTFMRFWEDLTEPPTVPTVLRAV